MEHTRRFPRIKFTDVEDEVMIHRNSNYCGMGKRKIEILGSHLFK